jgi:hypothetical protein
MRDYILGAVALVLSAILGVLLWIGKPDYTRSRELLGAVLDERDVE